MEVTGKNGLGNFLKIILQVAFFVGIILLISLPFVLHVLGLNLGAVAFVLYPNGTVILVIVYKFIKLFESLKNNNPFCDENVKILKGTGKASLIGSGFWLLDLLFEIFLAKSDDIVLIFTLAFLCILFFGVYIALYILSDLLSKAAEYKKENELTI